MVISELLSHKPLITAGYQAILHLHSLICECEIEQLLQEFSKKNKPSKRPPTFVRTGAIITCRITVELPVPIEVCSVSTSTPIQTGC
jgi:peptide chain release factor subunit 3